MPHAKLIASRPDPRRRGALALAPSLAAEAASPDWPCVQRKVATLTSAQMWDGPRSTILSGWRGNEEMSQAHRGARQPPRPDRRGGRSHRDVCRRPSRKQARRGAQAAVRRRARPASTASAPGDGGHRALPAASAGRAHEIERQGAEIRQLKERAAQDEGARNQLTVAEDKYNWDVRVFTERQQSLPLACEVPVLIEQRLFELGREIRSHMRD